MKARIGMLAGLLAAAASAQEPAPITLPEGTRIMHGPFMTAAGDLRLAARRSAKNDEVLHAYVRGRLETYRVFEDMGTPPQVQLPSSFTPGSIVRASSGPKPHYLILGSKGVDIHGDDGSETAEAPHDAVFGPDGELAFFGALRSGRPSWWIAGGGRRAAPGTS